MEVRKMNNTRKDGAKAQMKTTMKITTLAIQWSQLWMKKASDA